MPPGRLATSPTSRGCAVTGRAGKAGCACRWALARRTRLEGPALGRGPVCAMTHVPGTAFDLVTMGRSSIDLYSNVIGAAFEDITSFAAYVGGSPLNIAVGARRLGLRTALLTAVGEDKVGYFVLAFLSREGVDT